MNSKVIVTASLISVVIVRVAKWQDINFFYLLPDNSVMVATLTHNTERHKTEHMVTSVCLRLSGNGIISPFNFT